MTSDTKLPAPPYVGFRSFSNFIEWLAEVGVPTRIDRSFWGQKLSGANGMQVMAALRFLSLVDEENRPSPVLEKLAGNAEDRKATLRGLLEDSYAPALAGLDLSRASAGELQERFRKYNVTGETYNKILSFFLGAAQYAELPLSPHILRMAKGGARVRPTSNSGGKGKQGGASGRGAATPPPPPPPPPPAHNNEGVRIDLHPAVVAMLRDLERIAGKWTTAQRTQWETAFKTMLDYAYPSKEEDA